MSEVDIHRKTPIIEFQRQLLPQPPKDASPYFCYTNTLIFYSKDRKEVWRQQIPEANQLEPFQTENEDYMELEPRHGQHAIHVEYQERWGWVLKFTIAHESAKRIWAVLFPGVAFTRKLFRDSKRIEMREQYSNVYYRQCFGKGGRWSRCRACKDKPGCLSASRRN